MNDFTIVIIIGILLLIILIKLYLSLCTGTQEHLTIESNEAIQNVASLYNANQLTVTKLNTTSDTNVGGNANVTGTVTSAFSNPGKLQLGQKWVMTGTGKDTSGYDDNWLRVLDSKGNYL